jgi:putative ABC transport system ATP-binding protein
MSLELTRITNISLTVNPGEVAVVAGTSGSGKSTLLSIAGLLLNPDEGSVKIGGVDATALNDRARSTLRANNIALIFQGANLFPSLTAREQLHLVAHIRGELNDAAKHRAEDLLETVGLSHRADHLPSRLSGGERQRVGIARALMSQPTVLLVDEPTAALDPERSQSVMELLFAQTAAQQTATVLVTHDLHLVEGQGIRLRLDRGILVAP